MAFTTYGRYAPHRFSLTDWLGQSVADIVAQRQRQAEQRLVAYLRGLPEHVIRKLGVPPADMEKLCRRVDGHPPGLYGRVSIVGALHSSRR